MGHPVLHFSSAWQWYSCISFKMHYIMCTVYLRGPSETAHNGSSAYKNQRIHAHAYTCMFTSLFVRRKNNGVYSKHKYLSIHACCPHLSIKLWHHCTKINYSRIIFTMGRHLESDKVCGKTTKVQVQLLSMSAICHK